MHQAIDLIFAEDIIKLPKEIREEASLIAGLPTEYDTFGNAQGIFNILRNGKSEVRTQVYNVIKDRVFAGKKGITWHKLPPEMLKIDIQQAFTEQLGVNPFEQYIKREPQNLDVTAKVVGACCLEGKRYLIRFMVKVRVEYTFSLDVANTAIGAFVTVILDQDLGFIEIRDDPKYATRILRELTSLINSALGVIYSPTMNQLLHPLGGRIEDLVEILHGSIISTDCRTELLLEELTDDQVLAVSNILVGINQFFENDDINSLHTILSESKQCLTDFEGIPFSAILLSGMEKLGFSVKEQGDIRFQPLISALKPHLQYQGCFIKVPVNENGLVEYHTIRIGLQTNSISFRTFASENAINLLRKTMLA